MSAVSPELLAGLVRGSVRLSTREGGGFLKAYLEPIGTKKGGLLVSTLCRSCVDADPDLVDDWRRGLQLWVARLTQRARDAQRDA